MTCTMTCTGAGSRPHADLIAEAVIEQYNSLPRKRKPTVRDNGIHEWVPLSGIVAEYNGTLRCLALATGMKCLPASKLSEAQGNGVHDWHAEVLAIRAFNHFVISECKVVLSRNESDIIQRRAVRFGSDFEKVDEAWHGQPFGLKDDVSLYMYCSEAPCGDASMELTMAAQEDPTPWLTGSDNVDAGAEECTPTALPGRGYFSRLGIVRRKPSRRDAEATLSKSCSDKLALKQCTSLLSSLTSLLVSPERAYLRAIILPTSQYCAAACERCFSATSTTGRMKSVANRTWGGGYGFRPVLIIPTDVKFAYSRAVISDRADKLAPSNMAATWTCLGLEEGLLGGVLQGRKGFGDKCASRLSRKQMWLMVSEIAAKVDDDARSVSNRIITSQYGLMKNHHFLAPRRRAKAETKQEALDGWIPNAGDDQFNLVHPIEKMGGALGTDSRD